MNAPRPILPLHPRVLDVLASREARLGGIVSLPADPIDRDVGRPAFVAAMCAAGFAVFRAAGRYVVFSGGGATRV